MEQLTDEGLAEVLNKRLEELENQGKVSKVIYDTIRKLNKNEATSESETMYLMNFLFDTTPDEVRSLRDVQN